MHFKTWGNNHHNCFQFCLFPALQCREEAKLNALLMHFLCEFWKLLSVALIQKWQWGAMGRVKNFKAGVGPSAAHHSLRAPDG